MEDAKKALLIPPHIANAPCVGHNAEGVELVEIEIDIMGRPTLSRATREDAAKMEDGKRQWQEHCTKLESKIAAASGRYRNVSTEANRRRLMEMIKRRLISCDSHERGYHMVKAVMSEPPEIFWPIVIENWSACDASHHAGLALLRLMRFHIWKNSRRWMGAKPLKLYDALPDLVEVWRGTDRKRVRSISWSTSRNVAERFATGMRGGPFPDPVIAHAFVPKEHIFWANNDRDEQEIVLDPKRIRKLTIESFEDGFRGRTRQRPKSRATVRQSRKVKGKTRSGPRRKRLHS